MGILDWLTDMGTSGASGLMPGADGGMMPQAAGGSPPAPPAQPPQPLIQPTQAAPPPQGLDANGPSPVQMTGQDAAPLPPGQQGASSSPAPQVPLPQPRPADAPQVGGPAALPPNAAPTQGTLPQQPGPPIDITSQAQNSQTPAPASQQGGNFSLTRALGLNLSDAQRGALGAGLKSVGDNSSKPGLAAFAGSLGSGMEGAKATTDKTFDQKIKYLQQAVAAQQAGDKAAYNKNYAAYLTGKLKNDQDTAAAKGNGKTGAWNKPDSQKFIDAQHALAADPEIKASQKLLEQTAKTAEPAEVAKAQAAHSALIKQKEAGYLAGVGLNPQKVQNLAQNPPGSRGNPTVVTSKEEFDQYVKPGDAYVNPKDGKVYIRKGESSNGGGDQAPAAPSAPPSAPVAPGPAPRGAPAEDDD